MAAASACEAIRQLVSFSRFHGDGLLQRVGDARVEDWLSSTGWALSTRGVARARAGDFLRWATDAGHLDRAAADRARLGVDDPAWCSLLSDYLGALEARGLNAGGISTTKSRLTNLARELSGVDPQAVTLDDLDRWASSTTWSPGVQQLGLRAARAMLRWAEDTGRIVQSAAIEAERESAARRAEDGRWESALAGFELWLASSTRSMATADGYLKHVGWLADTCGRGPWELSRVELGAWSDSQNWSTETRRKVMTSLRMFYDWATSEGLCEWAPTAGLVSALPRRRGPRRKQLPAAWSVHVDEFVAAGRAGGRQDSTLESRVHALGRLAEVAADPWAITPEQLTVWLSTPDWGPDRRRNVRSALRVFYRWAVRTGRIDKSPAEDLDSVLVPRGLPRPAPEDAIRAAYLAADDRCRLMLMFAALAGLRRAEIARVHTSQLVDGQILIVGKGGHQRLVGMLPDLRSEVETELLRRRRGERGTGFERSRFVSEHGYLFPSDLTPGPLTAGHVGNLINSQLPDGWTTHTLRHRFATSTYAAHHNLRAVQEMLGHAKPETTAIYTQVSTASKQASLEGAAMAWA